MASETRQLTAELWPAQLARELRFTVVGLPVPKGSTKSFVYTPAAGGKPRAATTSDNPKTRGWQQTIANCAALELLRAEYRGLFFTAGVELEVWFYLPRPLALQTKRATGRIYPHTKKPDLDKLARACKDALSKVVWNDDAQVTDLLVHKRYAATGQSPHAVIAVRAGVREEEFRALLV